MSDTQVVVLPPAERAALALKSSTIEAELRTLAASSADIVAVIDPAGRDQAHRMAMNLRNRRTEITRTGKEARDDANKFSTAVIAEEKRLIGLIEPEEERIFTLRDGYDAEQARIEAERVAKERLRMEAHEAAISIIAKLPTEYLNKSAAEVLACRDKWAAEVPGDEWEEYREKAAAAIADAVEQLQAMYVTKLAAEEAERIAEEARETERLRVAAEAERLATQRAEQAAEAQRLADQQAEMKRQADELAAQRAEFEAQQRAASVIKEPELQEVVDPVAAEPVVIAVDFFPEAKLVRNNYTPVHLPVSAGEPTLRLGHINDRLAPIVLSADGLKTLGFEPSKTEKGAKLFHEAEFPLICAALVMKIEAAKEKLAA